MARDWRDDRIEELERENAALRAENRELRRCIAQLEARVRELEAQLARYSGNSSCPPSSDPPGSPPPALPKRTGRKRGGQPGHEKHARPLVPRERVNRTIAVKPDACRRCGDALEGDDPEPFRHQVCDVPKVMYLFRGARPDRPWGPAVRGLA